MLLLPYGAKRNAKLASKAGQVKSARAAGPTFMPYGDSAGGDMVSKVGAMKVGSLMAKVGGMKHDGPVKDARRVVRLARS